MSAAKACRRGVELITSSDLLSKMCVQELKMHAVVLGSSLRLSSGTPARSTRIRREKRTRVSPSSANTTVSMSAVKMLCERLDWAFAAVAAVARCRLPLWSSASTSSAASNDSKCALSCRLPLVSRRLAHACLCVCLGCLGACGGQV
jgi:hypothetical protein